MTDRLPEPDDVRWLERVPAVVGALAIPGVWLWTSRGQWDMAVPAFLVAGVLGLAGVGVYWLVAGRRRAHVSLDAWFASAAAPIAVASAAAVWYTEGGLGWGAALGSVTAGVGVSCWLLFVRISVWGLPEEPEG